MKELTLKEKIAQMLICGFDGTKANASTTKLVQRLKVGGVILYAKNTPTANSVIEQTRSLHKLAESTALPLIISIDHEHGRVFRIKEGTTRFIDMASVGKMDDLSLLGKIADITSHELLACGVNLNFAPVCDVNINPKNEVIGDRSFSPDPDTTAKMVTAYIKAGARTGILLCAKHFPGHGDTSVDSHKNLPTVDKTLIGIEQCELIPFKAAIDAGVQTIMTAHILFPRIDNIPATMSKTILTDLLRKKLGFNGLIISDDMEMGAIAKNYGTREAFIRSINAGVDMFIISNMISKGIDVEQLIDDLAEAVTNGLIDEGRIAESVNRIVEIKNKYLTKLCYYNTRLMAEDSLEFAKKIFEQKEKMTGQQEKMP